MDVAGVCAELCGGVLSAGVVDVAEEVVLEDVIRESKSNSKGFDTEVVE
jgi:hypothetical protein